jgi:hypothetical protein
MKHIPTNSTILDPKPFPRGFIKGEYYAVPDTKRRLVVFHNGTYLKTCRNENSAKNVIMKHKKRRK